MIYLIAKVIFWIVAGFGLGAWLGWWLRRQRARQTEAELTTELASTGERLAAAAVDLDFTRDSLDKSQATLGEKEQDLLTQTNEYLQLQRVQAELEENLGHREAELTQVSSDLELAKASAQAQESEFDDLKIEHAALFDRYSIADKDQHALSQTNAEQALRIQEIEALQKTQSRDMEQHNAKVSGLEEQHKRLQEQFKQEQQSLTSARKNNEELEAKVATLLGDLNSLKEINDRQQQELQGNLAKVREEAAGAEQQTQALQRENAELSSTAESQQLKIERLTKDVRNWRGRIPTLQAELDEKEMELRDREGRLSVQAGQLLTHNSKFSASLPEPDEHALNLRQELEAREQRVTEERTQLEALRRELEQRHNGPDTAQLEQENARLEAALLASQQRLMSRNSNVVPQQQKDARIAALSGENARLRAELRSQETLHQADRGAGQRPSMLMDRAPTTTDNLQKIKGVGAKLESTLNELGIFTFRQIAELSVEDVKWVDEHLNFKGRIDRDQWIAQAQALRLG